MVTEDIRTRLRALRREMGNVISVLNRKGMLNHDEQDQIVMLTKWPEPPAQHTENVQ